MDVREPIPGIGIKSEQFSQHWQQLIHSGAMGELYYRKTGSDFIWDHHFPEVAERVDQIGKGLIIKGKFRDYKGTEQGLGVSYKTEKEKLALGRTQRLIDTSQSDSFGRAPLGTWTETSITNYEKWVKAAGPHSKLGVFYRQLIERLQEWDPKQLFSEPLPGDPVSGRDHAFIVEELKTRGLRVEEDSGSVRATEMGSDNLSLWDVQYDRSGRMTMHKHTMRYPDSHTVSWEKRFTYDKEGRLIGVSRKEVNSLTTDVTFDRVQYRYAGDNSTFARVYVPSSAL